MRFTTYMDVDSGRSKWVHSVDVCVISRYERQLGLDILLCLLDNETQIGTIGPFRTRTNKQEYMFDKGRRTPPHYQ